MQGERELEYRFVVERSAAEGVLRRAATYLPPEVHVAERPVAYSRTLYLDSDDGMFLRTFKSGTTACRVRARQYAAATDLSAAAHVASGAAFLELKRTCGLEREKIRVELTRDQLAGILAGEAVPAEAQERIDRVPVLAEVVAGVAAGAIKPCLLTWYRRWSLGGLALRITLDEGIAYCLPEPLAAAGDRAEPRAVIARDALAVLELKMSAAMPSWLEAEVSAIRRHLAFRHSKFRAGMEALRHAQPAIQKNDREFRNAG